MEQRLSIVTLGVADLDRSRAFYERLGWRRAMPNAEGVAFFQLGGIALALYPRAALAKDAGIAADGNGLSRVSLAQNVRTAEEVDAVLAEALAAGARLLQPAQKVFWGGYSGHFADPDGFPWEVAWNPAFALAADGRITLPA
jgi:catechol 2,3-dioxygenase-like lactoylglutathione lyase family enzyme